jgi:tetratricopeptide (TPR) repeat protein
MMNPRRPISIQPCYLTVKSEFTSINLTFPICWPSTNQWGKGTGGQSMWKRWRIACVSILSLSAQAMGQCPDLEQSARASEKLQGQGKAGEAEQTLLECLRDSASKPPAGLALVYNNLASAIQDQGRYVEAERHYRRSIALWRGVGPSGRLGEARTLNNLASLLWFVGRMQEAERDFEESARQHFESLGPDDPETSVVYSNLGTIQLKKRKWKEAERSFEQALSKLQGPARTTRAAGWLYYGLGVARYSTHRAKEAEGSLRSAQAIWEPYRAKGELEPRHLVHLAMSYRFTSQPDEVKRLLRQAVDAVEGDSRMTPGEQVFLLRACAAELKQFPQLAKEAREMERRSKSILDSDAQLRMIRETVHVSSLMDGSPGTAPGRGAW